MMGRAAKPRVDPATPHKQKPISAGESQTPSADLVACSCCESESTTDAQHELVTLTSTCSANGTCTCSQTAELRDGLAFIEVEGLSNGHVQTATPTPAARLEVLSRAGDQISFRQPRCRHKPALARGIELTVGQLTGVISAQANPVTARVRVRFDAARVSTEEIETAIAAAQPVDESQAVEDAPSDEVDVESSLCADPLGPCCYIGNYVGKQPPAIFKGSAERTKLEQRQLRAQRKRVAIGAAGVVALLGSMVVFGPAIVASPLMAIAAGGATLASGYPLLKDGFRSLTGKSPLNPNALVAAATVASLLLGEGLTALVVIALLNVGALLQMLTLFRTRRAIQDLLSIGDKEVWLVVNGVEVKVPLESLRVGDTVAVYADEKIPVDGAVLEGSGSVNQALVTGESMPVYRNPGDEVYAGTVLELGSLRVRASRVGAETEVGRLIDRVEQARELRAPMETIAETFSRRFVPVSFALAALVFLVTRDIRRAMTMLVIACPCAAGLSTPTAVTASIGNAARRGVLIKGGANLEAAGKIDTIILDKTGTLTTGKAVVSRVASLAPEFPADQVLRIAASAELHSKHPLALAVLRHAREAAVEIPDHDECEMIAGRGARAEMDGKRILVGSDRLLTDFAVSVPSDVRGRLADLRRDGQTVVLVAVNDQAVGLIGVSDTLRPQARESVAALRRAGVEHVILCTGDSEEIARSVARELELTEYHAEYLPEDKFNLVKELKEAGHRVAMVGDGINDAPALAIADVGIAMGTAGSDVAIEAADISLASDDLLELATVLDLSRHTIGVVKQNYALALGVNGTGILIGAAGALNPILAAIVHNLSTIAVVANSGRLIGYLPPGGHASELSPAVGASSRADVLDSGTRGRCCDDENCTSARESNGSAGPVSASVGPAADVCSEDDCVCAMCHSP